MSIQETTADRIIRVAAVSTPPDPSADGLSWVRSVLEEVATSRPHLVCLPEAFHVHGTNQPIEKSGQSIEGPIVQAMREQAHKMRACLVFGLVLYSGEGLSNSAIIVNEYGDIAGRFDKMKLTQGEREAGFIPGPLEQPPIDLGFARIGGRICFDANWPGVWSSLKAGGVEIACFPSLYPAGRLLESAAALYRLPIVGACPWPTSRIIDCDGQVLNRQGIYRNWAMADLHLDSPLFHLDFQKDKLERIRKDYGTDVDVRVYEESGWWRIFPKREGLSVREIIDRFALEPLDDYLERVGGPLVPRDAQNGET